MDLLGRKASTICPLSTSTVTMIAGPKFVDNSLHLIIGKPSGLSVVMEPILIVGFSAAIWDSLSERFAELILLEKKTNKN